MLNITLTIAAAPEFLAAISSLTNAIASIKVASVPQINSEFKPAHEQDVAQIALNQQAPLDSTYQVQNQVPNQVNTTQQPQYNQTSSNVVPVYNQLTVTPNNTVQASSTQGGIVPTSTQTYTMEQLAVAATQIVDAGRRTELVGLLNSFGVQALTALPKEQYGAFATQLRVLGAKI